MVTPFSNYIINDPLSFVKLQIEKTLNEYYAGDIVKQLLQSCTASEFTYENTKSIDQDVCFFIRILKKVPEEYIQKALLIYSLDGIPMLLQNA